MRNLIPLQKAGIPLKLIALPISCHRFIEEKPDSITPKTP